MASLNSDEEKVDEIELTAEQAKKLPKSKILEMMSRLSGEKRTLAVVKLYKGNKGDWDVVSEGCLFLVENEKSLAFHLLNLSTCEVIWSHELYETIVIHLLQEYFASFEGLSEGQSCMWGFSFAHVYSGKEFCKKTMESIKRKQPHKKKSSVFSGIKNWWSEKKRNRRKPQKRVMISSPRNFKKKRHIGNLDIPPEWMKFLTEELKFSSDDLQSEETIDRIFRILERFTVDPEKKAIDEEKQLREEMDIQKELDGIDRKMEELKKRKQKLLKSLKQIRSSESTSKENEEEDEEEAMFADAEEEDWIEVGKGQEGSELPVGSPPANKVPPPFPPPDISKFVPREERVKDATKKKITVKKPKKKRELPKLTPDIMQIMREEVRKRREQMNMESEEKVENTREGDGGWSSEEEGN